MAARSGSVVLSAAFGTVLLVSTVLGEASYVLVCCFLVLRVIATGLNAATSKKVGDLGGEQALAQGFEQRMNVMLLGVGLSYGIYAGFITESGLDEPRTWLGGLILVAIATLMLGTTSHSRRGTAFYLTGLWAPSLLRLFTINDLAAIQLGVSALFFVTMLLGYSGRLHEQLRSVTESVISTERLLVQVTELRAHEKRNNEQLNELNEQLREALERAEYAASYDHLTGAMNRRAFTGLAERRKGSSSTSSLLLVDFDHFKTINDTCGHEVGDVVLARGAEVMQEVLRPNDLLARWGGEEFLILLPSSNLEEATAIGERLRMAIADRLVDVTPGCAAGGPTVSIGLAEVHATDELQRAIGLADAALYRAKESGRNRLSV